MNRVVYSFPFLVLLLADASCSDGSNTATTGLNAEQPQLTFVRSTIADSVSFLWAHDPVDITNDGIADLVFVDNNHTGGQLG